MADRRPTAALSEWRRNLLEVAARPGVTTGDIAKRLDCSRDLVNREIRLALKAMRPVGGRAAVGGNL